MGGLAFRTGGPGHGLRNPRRDVSGSSRRRRSALAIVMSWRVCPGHHRSRERKGMSALLVDHRRLDLPSPSRRRKASQTMQPRSTRSCSLLPSMSSTHSPVSPRPVRRRLYCRGWRWTITRDGGRRCEQFMQGYKKAWERAHEAQFCALRDRRRIPQHALRSRRGHAELAAHRQRVKMQEDVQVRAGNSASARLPAVAHRHVTYQVARRSCSASGRSRPVPT